MANSVASAPSVRTSSTDMPPQELTGSRWLIPIAAIAVHLCIGSVYAWSVFNKPIIKLLPAAPAWFSPPYTTFSTALVLLGLSAAFGGPWVERVGPRKAAMAAAVFFGSGLLIGGLGLRAGLPWMVFVGMGIVSGIGCGLGYIAPVSTLVKWFPDRRGMATGLAVMGFGGGALLAGYLNALLIAKIGVANTILTLGVVYFGIMLLGAQLLRRPPAGWKPSGWTPPTLQANKMRVGSLARNEAIRTSQFWLLWAMLFINVTAGIGILAQASPLMQNMFARTPVQAGVMVSLISLFNAGGRLFWAALSDRIGRRSVYLTFFAAQCGLFVLIPILGERGAWPLFQLTVFIIFTMYGGGFATIPAFLADIFGPDNVGAIHGAVLTAWSAAAVVGPVIVTQLSQRSKANTLFERVHSYDTSLHVMACLLAVGFVLALLVRPLRDSESA